MNPYPINPTASTPDTIRWFLSGQELDVATDTLHRRIARAQQSGFNGEVSIHSEPSTRTYTPGPDAWPITLHGFSVSVLGRPSIYDGWQVLAETTNDRTGPYTSWTPGAEKLTDELHVRPGACDDCQLDRPRRLPVVTLLDTRTGELRQVHTTCLAEFLGRARRPPLITNTALYRSLAPRPTRYEIGAGDWDLTATLTYAWAAVAARGWTPASRAGRNSTRDLVATAMRGGPRAALVLAELAPHLAEGARRAPAIITDLATHPPQDDYQHHLRDLLTTGKVDPQRELGLAVSAILAHHQLPQGGPSAPSGWPPAPVAGPRHRFPGHAQPPATTRNPTITP